MPVLDMPLEELRKYEGTNPCPADIDSYWEKAIAVYENVSKVKTETSNSYYGISLFYFMLNKNDEALDYLLKSFELNSGNESTFLDEFPNFEATQLYIKLTDSL